MTTSPPTYETHARHEDDTFIDRMEVVTVERWKESELSGDEWRFSYHVRLYRKDVCVLDKGFGSMQYAASWLALHVAGDREDLDVTQLPPDGVLCDQPGCAMPGTERRTLIRRYCRYCGEPKELAHTVYWRVFCAKHAERGDCGLDDADRNYVETAHK